MGFYDGTPRTIQDLVEDVLAKQCYTLDCQHLAVRECELCPRKMCKSHGEKCYNCGLWVCFLCQPSHEEDCPMRPEDTAALDAQRMAWRDAK